MFIIGGYELKRWPIDPELQLRGVHHYDAIAAALNGSPHARKAHRIIR
jgi:hypothetical protein